MGFIERKTKTRRLKKTKLTKIRRKRAANRKDFRRAAPIIPRRRPVSSGRPFAQPPFKESTAPGGRNNIELQIKINLNFIY
jgi:hypothetical protein